MQPLPPATISRGTSAEEPARARVSPIPRRGEVIAGRDTGGRLLRVSSHPERGRVVLSIWQDGVCLGTVRLASTDLPVLVRSLARSMVELEAADEERHPDVPIAG